MQSKIERRYRDKSEIIEDYLLFLQKVKKTIAGTTSNVAVLQHVDLSKAKVGPYTYKAMEDLSIIKLAPQTGDNRRFYKWIYGDDDITIELANMVRDCQIANENNNRGKHGGKTGTKKDIPAMIAEAKVEAPKLEKADKPKKAKKVKEQKVEKVGVLQVIKSTAITFSKQQLEFMSSYKITQNTLQINGIELYHAVSLEFVGDHTGLLVAICNTEGTHIASITVESGLSFDTGMGEGLLIITAI